MVELRAIMMEKPGAASTAATRAVESVNSTGKASDVAMVG